MPNWSKGSLRIRGKGADIVKFITEGICNSQNYIENKDTYFSFYTEKDNPLYINKSDRCFVEHAYVYIEQSDMENTKSVALASCASAWNWELKDIMEICNTYHIDVAITAYEQGQEFRQDIMVVYNNGTPKVLKNHYTEFDDYNWECESPCLGG